MSDGKEGGTPEEGQSYAQFLAELHDMPVDYFQQDEGEQMPPGVASVEGHDRWDYILDEEVGRVAGGRDAHALTNDGTRAGCGAADDDEDQDHLPEFVWKGSPERAVKKDLTPCTRCLRIRAFTFGPEAEKEPDAQ